MIRDDDSDPAVLFAALRVEETPDGEAVTRARARLLAFVASAPAAEVSRPRTYWKFAAVGLVGAALALASGPDDARTVVPAVPAAEPLATPVAEPRTHVATATQATEPAGQIDPTGGPVATGEPVASASPIEPLPRRAATDAPRRPMGRAARSTPIRSAADDASATRSLAEELRLLEQARGAERRGSFSDALSALRAHERRFPDGALVPERELVWTRVLCSSGDAVGARARALAFSDAFPKSHLIARLNDVCRGQNP